MGEAVRIRVIANKPAEGQTEIHHLIGKEFLAKKDPDNRGRVFAQVGEEQYILQPGEWEEVK